MSRSTVHTSTDPSGKRAVGYARVSTAKQADHGLSLREQTRRIRVYAADAHLALGVIYTERGVSGAKDSRPELDRMLAAACSGAFDVLIVPHIDRLGRSARMLHNVWHELSELGIALVFLAQNIDSTTPYGRAQLGMLAVFAEFEREMIAERVTAAMSANAARGKPHGRLHYGYRLNPDRKHGGPSWIPDPFQVTIYERMYAGILAGESQQKVARKLNADGIRTSNGGTWTQGTVRKLLRSRVPLGERKFHDEWHPADYEPIICVETWTAAQAIMSANARPNGSHGGRGRATRSGHVFTGGLLKCGCCGGSMVPRSGKYPGYHCMTRKSRGPDACPMAPVPKWIDEGVLTYFKSAALDVEATIRQIAEANERLITEARVRREHAEREGMSIEERIRRVRRDYQDGKLDADDWREQRRDLLAESEAAERAITDAIENEQRSRRHTETADAEKEALQRLAAISKAVEGITDDPTTLDGFRTTLQRLFSGFTLHLLDPETEHDAARPLPTYWQPELLLPRALYIEPHVRPDAIKSRGPGNWPNLNRVALDGNTETNALPSLSSQVRLGGPAFVEAVTGGCSIRAIALMADRPRLQQSLRRPSAGSWRPGELCRRRPASEWGAGVSLTLNRWRYAVHEGGCRPGLVGHERPAISSRQGSPTGSLPARERQRERRESGCERRLGCELLTRAAQRTPDCPATAAEFGGEPAL